jgi:hypothetical protein
VTKPHLYAQKSHYPPDMRGSGLFAELCAA